MTYRILLALWIIASGSVGSAAETGQCVLGSEESCPGQDSLALLQGRIHVKESAEAIETVQAIETIKLRGHLVFNRSALTEGPRHTKHHHKFDSVESYMSHHSKSKQQRYIVGWKPVVNQHKCPDGSTVELVHHMCVHSMHSHTKEGTNPEMSHEGLHLVASYDRGSTEYHLPSGYGIPIDHLTLEYHLLVPPCWDFSQSVMETSGMDVYVTTQKPKKLAAVVGFTDEHMRIPRGHGAVEQVSELKPDNLKRIFNAQALADLQGGPTVDLLAVHLHTHEISTSKSFEVLNPDGSSLFHSKEEATGYGDKQQSFIDPQEKGIPSRIKPGQSYRMHCRYETNKIHHDVVDGTSHGDEMCCALLIVGGDGLNQDVGTMLSSQHGGVVYNVTDRRSGAAQSHVYMVAIGLMLAIVGRIC